MNQYKAEGLAFELYMTIGAYEGIIHKYANPTNYTDWDKYNRLKKKILQWQKYIA